MKDGWPKATLGTAFTVVTGTTPPKNNPGLYGCDIPLVKPPELRNATVGSAKDGLSKAGGAVARIAPAGSVLVSCIGNLGKVGLSIAAVAFNQQINAILPNPQLAIPEFMFYQVLSTEFGEQLAKIASGTTVAIVNKAKFNGIQVVLPPLRDQQRIVGILDEAFAGIATARENAERNLRNARALFESNSNAVFARRGPGWVDRQLGDMAELITKGTTPTSVGHAFVPEGINFVKVESISEDGRFIEAKLAHITRECHEALGRSRLKSGDILFSIAGALGRTALVTSDVLPANTNQALAIIRLSKSNDVVSAYVLAALQADFTLEQIERLRGGVAQQNLSLAQLRELPIPLPSPAVQQSIVRHLGATRVETRRLESVYQRKLTALNELKKSLLHQAFSGQLRST